MQAGDGTRAAVGRRLPPGDFLAQPGQVPARRQFLLRAGGQPFVAFLPDQGERGQKLVHPGVDLRQPRGSDINLRDMLGEVGLEIRQPDIPGVVLLGHKISHNRIFLSAPVLRLSGEIAKYEFLAAKASIPAK